MSVLEKCIRVEFATIENGKVYKDAYFIHKSAGGAQVVPFDEHDLVDRYTQFKTESGVSMG